MIDNRYMQMDNHELKAFQFQCSDMGDIEHIYPLSISIAGLDGRMCIRK